MDHTQMMLDKITTLESKENGRHFEQMEAIKGVHRKQDIANKRTTKLEKKQAYTQGALAVLTVIILPILFLILTRVINEINF